MTKMPPTSLDDAQRTLLRFHLHGGAGAPPAEPRSDLGLPIPVAGVAGAGFVRSAFPLHVPPAALDGPTAEPLSVLLDRLAPPPDRGRVLRDNLLRLERAVSRVVEAAGGPTEARAAMARGAEQLRGELTMTAEAGAALEADLDALVLAVPEGGQLLPWANDLHLHLLHAVALRQHAAQRARIGAEVEALLAGLNGLLQVEAGKSESARGADAVAGAVGETDGLLDVTTLARSLGSHRGSERMDPARRDRVAAAAAELRTWLTAGSGPELVTLGDAGPSQPGWLRVAAERPIAAAVARFDRAAADTARLVRAIRRARIELEGRYTPSVDAWLDGVDWHAFESDDLLLLPVIAAVLDVEAVVGPQLGSLVELLLSGRPIHVILTTRPGRNPGGGDDPLARYHFEAGRLGIAHGHAFVQQSCAAHPDHLVRGFERALAAPRAGLHVLAVAPEESASVLPQWLSAAAAVDGRAHPLFQYAPLDGAAWAHRMDVADNPEPEADWPSPNGAGAVGFPFTFADYALLDPALHHQFEPVPDGVSDDALIPLHDFLDASGDEASARIPFIRARRGDGTDIRLAVSRRLALASGFRRDAWRTLRELGGVRSEYVERAVAAALDTAHREAEAERAQARAEHEAREATARSEATREAMSRLAHALVSADPGRFSAMPATSPATARTAPAEKAPAAAPEPAAAAAPVAAPAAPAMTFDDPWIDSALCTTCGDCLAINGALFVYNDDKQAVIGDPKSGSFSQLVTAAEACPAKCIHPGKPLNPSEPNLPELIKRAEPFN